MGQIRGTKAKISACNLRSLSSFGIPYAGMHILVSTDNSAMEDGNGNFDAYVVGDGHTAAEALEIKKIEPVLEVLKATFERMWNFTNGDIVENVLLYLGNTGYTAGLFVTPYIDIESIKTHKWKWYIGTDRSGYSGNITSLRIEFFDENKAYKGYYSYTGDPRTIVQVPDMLTYGKYIRITFVMTGDCYLKDLVTGDYIWYGYYEGKKALEVVDAKVNTNKVEISKTETVLARVNGFSNGDVVENALLYLGNTGYTAGVFVTPYIDVADVKSHRWKWYIGTDRSGYSGNIASLRLECFDENKTYFTFYNYNADPRTFSLTSADQARTKYIRITFVMTGDCYLQDLDTGYYIWYGYYVGYDKVKKTIDDAVASADLSNGMPQSNSFYLTNLIQSRRPHRDVASATSGKILSLLHFSDIHGQATPLKNILAFKDKYSSYIDDVLFTGDLVNDHFGQTNIFEDTSGAENILMTIGNHDVCLGNSVSPMDYVPYGGVTTLQGYNEFIAPFVSNWGVVQPTDAATFGLNYYYKDYDNIRLIVLDCFAPNGSTYIADQVSWLSDVLSSARTNSKAVVIAVHQTAAALDYIRETGFCSYERTTTAYIDGSFSNAVQSFMDAGGEFVCWLAGHTHCDLFGTLANHPNQTQITITCAYHDQYDDGRVVDTPTADSFNIVSFDTYSKLIKVLRVGNNEDRYLRPKNVLTWDYVNKKIVSTF